MTNKQFYALVGVWFGLSIGNFLYQWLFHANWDVAAERSLFQLVALIALQFANGKS